MFKTKFLMRRISFYYLRSLYKIIFWKISNFIYKFYGSLVSTGFYTSIIFCHEPTLALFVSYFNKVLKGGVKFDNATISVKDF